jgi:hypothetical protein
MGKTSGLNKLNDTEYINVLDEEFTVYVPKQTNENSNNSEENRKLGKKMSSYEIIFHLKHAKNSQSKEISYDYLIGYDPENKLNNYIDQINRMYHNVVEKFILEQAPTHIFDNMLFDNCYYDYGLLY